MLSSKTTLFLSLLLFLATHLHSQPVTWDVSKSYNLGDLVVEGTSTYIAKQGVPANSAISNTAYWENLATAASTLSKPVDEVPNLDINTILNSIPGAAPTSVSSSAAVSLSANDILIENTSTGERAAWKLRGAKWEFQTDDVLLSGGAEIGTYTNSTIIFGSGDFDQDGNIDLVSQDTSSGKVDIIFMNGNVSSSVLSMGSLGSSVKGATVADFNLDGIPDFITDDASSGSKSVTYLTGSGRNLTLGLTEKIATNVGYSVVGAGDFNQDGKTDLLAQQVTNSADPFFNITRKFWLMNGSKITSEVELSTFRQEWKCVGSGDFDQDGHVDVMVQQDLTGRRGIWYMNKTKIRDGFIYATLLPSWTTACSGDFNKDNSNDTVLFNSTSGKVIVLNLGNQDGTQNQFNKKYAFLNINRNFIPGGNSNAGTDWKMRGFIDFNSDNEVDILADNMSTGEKAIWQVNSNNVLSPKVFATKPNWRMCGTGAFGGDSTTDIVAENIQTGVKQIWIMSFSNNSFNIDSENTFATNSSCRLVGVGDFNLDGFPDILSEGLTTSSDPVALVNRQIWTMNGINKSTETTFATSMQEWRMRGVLDYDQNGQPDILIEPKLNPTR